MCYNVAYIEKRSERVAKHYGAAFKPEDRTPEFFTVSGFAHPELFVVTAGEPSLIQCYQWGLIPVSADAIADMAVDVVLGGLGRAAE